MLSCHLSESHLSTSYPSIAKETNNLTPKPYTDLSLPENELLRKTIVSENFHYAAYMYLGLQQGMRCEEDKEAILLSVSARNENLNNAKLLNPYRSLFEKITEKLTKEFGFKIDEEGNYYHLETGTLLNLIYDNKRQEIIVGFMGLNTEKRLRIDKTEQAAIGKASRRTSHLDLRGYFPPAVDEIIKIGKMFKEVTHDTGLTPVMVGHSHGGGLAQSAALATGLKGITFNSRPLGAGTRDVIGEATLAENAKNITCFTVKGDWLTDNAVVNSVGSFFRTIGLNTPRNIGTGYYLPRLEEKDFSSHSHFFYSFDSLKNL